MTDSKHKNYSLDTSAGAFSVSPPRSMLNVQVRYELHPLSMSGGSVLSVSVRFSVYVTGTGGVEAKSYSICMHV